MEPFTNSSTPPLSIAQVDWALDGERKLAALGSKRPDADMLAIQEALLAAVICRVGEVEAAEWALDQAKTACVVQVTAALAAGVPAEKLVAAAGELALSESVDNTEAVPAQG